MATTYDMTACPCCATWSAGGDCAWCATANAGVDFSIAYTLGGASFSSALPNLGFLSNWYVEYQLCTGYVVEITLECGNTPGSPLWNLTIDLYAGTLGGAYTLVAEWFCPKLPASPTACTPSDFDFTDATPVISSGSGTTVCGIFIDPSSGMTATVTI